MANLLLRKQPFTSNTHLTNLVGRVVPQATSQAEPRNRKLHLQDPMPATILLIDDNAVQAATRLTILKRAGYYVIAALSPERALEQFRNKEYPAPIDLVLTDHIMPGMNGSEFVSKLREFEPTLPVLVISGMSEAEEEYAGMNIHFRLKPLLPDNLLASVHHLLSSTT